MMYIYVQHYEKFCVTLFFFLPFLCLPLSVLCPFDFGGITVVSITLHVVPWLTTAFSVKKKVQQTQLRVDFRLLLENETRCKRQDTLPLNDKFQLIRKTIISQYTFTDNFCKLNSLRVLISTNNLLHVQTNTKNENTKKISGEQAY